MTLPWWQKPFQFHLDALSLPSRTPSCSGEPLQPLAAAGRQKARLQQGLDITTETKETEEGQRPKAGTYRITTFTSLDYIYYICYKDVYRRFGGSE